MAIGGAGDVFRINRLAGLAGDFRDGDDGFHGADVRQLRTAEHDVADSVDAWVGSLHPGIGFDETAVGLDFGAFEADVFGAGLAADGDQDFFGFDFLLGTGDGDGDRDSGFRFFYFVDFGAGVEVDAALAVDASEFFGDFFVFDGNQARQHFDDGHFAVKRAVDRGELHAYCSSADDDQGFWKVFQAEDFDVGENAVTGFETRKHAGFGAGGENYVFRFQVGGFVVVDDLDGEHAVLGGAGHFSVTLDRIHFIFLHQEFEAFGVLGDDFRFAVLDGSPVQLARVHAFDAEFFGVFEVIPEFGVEE